MDPRRAERVSEALREELEEVIGYEMADPRIDIAGIAEVLVSPDARRAHVRVDLRSDPERQQQTIDALNGARNFLRRKMARRLQMYRIPDLYFEAAVPAELGTRARQLLRRARRGRPKDQNFSPEKTSK